MTVAMTVIFVATVAGVRPVYMVRMRYKLMVVIMTRHV